MRATHTPPNLVREMDEMGITRSVLLPIDFPVLSHNAETALDVASESDRIVGFGSVHPWSRGLARKLDAQIALGARGVKVHPAVQCVRPDDPRAIRLYRLCGERGIPVLWHCGPVGIAPRLGEYLTQVRFYEKPIARVPAHHVHPRARGSAAARSRRGAAAARIRTCGSRRRRSRCPGCGDRARGPTRGACSWGRTGRSTIRRSRSRRCCSRRKGERTCGGRFCGGMRRGCWGWRAERESAGYARTE